MTTETIDRPKDFAEAKDRKGAESIPPGFKSSVCADEVVPAGSTIELEFDAPVDPQSAQSAISLTHENDPVMILAEVANHGRTIRVPLDKERTGSFQLTISELLGKKGERLVEHYSVAFVAMEFASDVPRDLRIEHAIRLVLGEMDATRLAPEQGLKKGHILALKVVSRKTGEPAEMAFDERGRKVDLDEQLTDLSRRRAERYGRIHPTLFDQIEKAKPDARVPVVLWPRIELPAAPYDKPTDTRSMEPPEGERRLTEKLREAHGSLTDAVRKAGVRLGKGEEADEGVPCISTEATVAQIRELASHDAVGAIYFDDQTAITDLANSISVARSDQAHLAGFDGTGIRVAVWEDGPSNTSNLVFAGRFSSSPPASDHARLTSAIVKNTERNKPHGHAPDCDLYSANSNSTAALRWAVRDRHCTVVSQSFHRSSEPKNSGLQSDDLLKDWLVLRWPYPTIVQAAGNFWKGDADNISPPENEFVNHKGFNSLAIGNHDDTAANMSGDSVFRNPASTHGDRELPELAANGTSVSANGQTKSGTSFASPATAGVAALIQDVDSVLCSWPEGCRAILMAAAGRNVRGDTWWRDVVNDVDGRDGAGAVDALAGVTVARQRRWRNAPATRHGWDVGTISSAVIGGDRLATFRYHVSVPLLLAAPKVKVALAWDSAVTSFLGIPLASRLTVDLDLIVRDRHGNQVASSASWDNSYEVAEFDGRPGQTYDIIVRRWSGTDSVWYGLAWTVRGLRIFVPPIDIETIAGVA
jgi:Subtilase family